MDASASTSAGLNALPVIEILKIGLSGFCFLLFYFTYRLLRKEQDHDEPRDSMLKAIWVSEVLIVVLAILVSATSIYGPKISEAHLAVMKDVFLGTIFEPQKGSEPNKFTYIGRAPNGLSRDVDTNPTFQDFSTNNILQRMWADPRNPHSLIKATRDTADSANRLCIEFVRKGYLVVM